MGRMRIYRTSLMLILALLLFSFRIAAEPATVSYVKGKVEVCRNNSWVPLKAGDTVKESETISTGFQSEAKLKYNDSVMAIGAMTRITLDALVSAPGKDTVSLYLIRTASA